MILDSKSVAKIISHSHGASTAVPASDGAWRLIASPAKPHQSKACEISKMRAPPDDSPDGINRVNKMIMTIEPVQRTWSDTEDWSRINAPAVSSAAIAANIAYGPMNDGEVICPLTNNISNVISKGAGHKMNGANLVHATPRTTRYDAPNAERSIISCARAYPTSKRLAAIAIKAPIIPRPTETDHKPGFPIPAPLKALLNQFSSRANRDAITAFKDVTKHINKKRVKGFSNERICNSKICQLLLKAWSPTHIFELAIPRDARLPLLRNSAIP